ncbi:MAG: pilus assembly protein TadG-related protein [Gammaproteobacteria bacterium]
MSGYITSSCKSQRGQTAVFVLLFTVVLLVSALALFKAGKITTNKMQLQNAADAAAFSMSTVEARDLNFAAYMNRAIVANEVAIGQLIGLASWAYHFKSFADYLDTYDKLFLSPATLGVSTPIVSAITGPWRGAGQTAIGVMSKIANFGTLVIHNINKIYGFAEFGYHTVSVIFAVGVLDDVIDQNGPPGTKISDFGVISLIAHIATYGVLPNLPGDQFATGYMSTKKIDVDKFGDQDSGYARLSALIRDSRDPFTMARGWELRPPGFPLEIETHPSFKIDILVASVEFGFDFEMTFDLSLERKGASELRFVLPARGKIKAGQLANWSSADTTGLFVQLIIDFYAWAEACALGICETVGVGGGFSFGDSKASLYLRIMGEDIEIIPEIPFPTSAPFGSGFAEAGKNTPNNLATKHMLLASLGGDIETEHYGEAANNLLAWISPGPTVPPIGITAAAQIYETTLGSRVNKSYSGLPYYVDTTGKGPFLGIGAPSLLIGMVQDEADYDTYYKTDKSVVDSAAEPEGRLRLNEAFASPTDAKLAVLAKSELYFSRPTDKFASHFYRGDGQIENGSAFNPFWQARLIDTTYADRTLGLAIQQKQDFINLSNSFDSLLNKLSGILPF